MRFLRTRLNISIDYFDRFEVPSTNTTWWVACINSLEDANLGLSSSSRNFCAVSHISRKDFETNKFQIYPLAIMLPNLLLRPNSIDKDGKTILSTIKLKNTLNAYIFFA